MSLLIKNLSVITKDLSDNTGTVHIFFKYCVTHNYLDHVGNFHDFDFLFRNKIFRKYNSFIFKQKSYSF